MSAEPPLRGEIRWALVPYVAQAPYAVVGEPDATTFADVVRQIRDGGPRSAVDLTLRTVLRPVLLVHGWESATHGWYDSPLRRSGKEVGFRSGEPICRKTVTPPQSARRLTTAGRR